MTVRNEIFLVGRAGNDPEVKIFEETGNTLVKISLAVKPYGKNAKTSWFNLVFWGNQAIVAMDYVKKGNLISIKGDWKLDEWTDKKTNEPRYKVVVTVNKLELLSSSGLQKSATSSTTVENQSEVAAF